MNSPTSSDDSFATAAGFAAGAASPSRGARPDSQALGDDVGLLSTRLAHVDQKVDTNIERAEVDDLVSHLQSWFVGEEIWKERFTQDLRASMIRDQDA